MKVSVKKNEYKVQIVVGFLLLIMANILLKEDIRPFMQWWTVLLILGAAAFYFSNQIFGGFADRGFLFSKVLAVLLTGLINWMLVSIHVIKYKTINSILVSVIVLALLNLGSFAYNKWKKKTTRNLSDNETNLIIWEEIIFFAMFLLWTYLVGFRPAAYGTEKFMDYGLMATLMRADYFPAVDMWYSQGDINYYYGGQYFATFLTRITFTKISDTYNLMRAFVAAMAFAMPFSLVYQMTIDREKFEKKVAVVSGVIAGVAVSMAGNLHYFIYSKIIPLFDKESTYWFPNSTRYIGYNPETTDKTIHEFPAYSFVLGDLHAHMVNIIFVLALLGICYAWGRNNSKKVQWGHLLLSGIFLGVFQFTNYWDYIIYFVVIAIFIFVRAMKRLKGQWMKSIAQTLAMVMIVFALAWIVARPFNQNFKSLFQGVGIVKTHSPLYQFLVLWGLPIFIVITFILVSFISNLKNCQKKKPISGFLCRENSGTLVAALFGCCAIGLVVLPELVYVRDIYENGYPRANTMFKLTYQAFILFGICIGYALPYFLRVQKLGIRILGGVFVLVWLLTCGYFGNAVTSWFGSNLLPSQRQGLDATAFLEKDFSEDAGAIRWLNENVTGLPIVLEADGDSYSDYERVSAMTGLPTLIGWSTHELLWHNMEDDLNYLPMVVETIYTSTSIDEVRMTLEEYNISYIFVGSKEREKYSSLNHTLLQKLGKIVYKDSGAYLIQVSNE